MINVCAIFGIGKTNKKFFLFDENYRIVYETSKNFSEITDEEGFSCDDIEAVSTWIKKSLQSIMRDEVFHIAAINFSTYGASFVHLGESGKVLGSLYNYLKPLPRVVEQQFYATHGTRQSISAATASPALGMLNSGLQLFWLKYAKPQLFNAITISLHLPQYVAYLIHGAYYADITSIGCHTALWDFERNNYHSWVRNENIDSKLASLLPSDAVVATTFDGCKLLSGVGLHDSSAAFIPYMQTVREPFALISTGTWCITMNPYNTRPLTVEELEQDCLCYMTYRGTPVKASRLFAGYEHEQAIKKMAAYYRTDEDFYTRVNYQPEWLPTVGINDGPIKYADYKNYDEAYHHLIYQLILQQKKSTDLVLNNSPVRKIFVDGGFAKNDIYMNLLAKAYPEHEVYAASVSQATALGAALAIHKHWNEKPMPDSLIELKRYKVYRGA